MSMSQIALTEEEIAALEALESTGSGEELVRVRVILLTERGWTGDRISEALGITAGTVRNLRSRFRRGGVAGLRTLPKPGRTPKIAGEAMLYARKILAERPIKAWSVPRLCEEIIRRGGPAISTRWMNETLKKTTSSPDGRGTRCITDRTRRLLTSSV